MQTHCAKVKPDTPSGARLSKGIFIAQTKFPEDKKLCKKMCRKGPKIQKKGDKISKIRLKEMIFTVSLSKPSILRSLWKILHRRASVCLMLLETLPKS